MSNPGTLNNNERSFDRDLSFSALMRPIRNIKVCDYDPFAICPNCEHPIAMWEVKRWLPADIVGILKYTKYTRIAADAFKVPAYFIHNQPDEQKLTVISLDVDKGFPRHTFTVSEFQAWVEAKIAKHVCTAEHLERKKRV